MTDDSNNDARHKHCSICAQLKAHEFGRQTHGRPVKYFSDSGSVRNDGQSFAWADLSRVVNQVRFRPGAPNTKFLWRTEIQFKSGQSAWLIPAKVSNYRDVREYVDNLPCEQTEVKV